MAIAWIPAFDLADGGIPLAMVRGTAVAAMFSSFGALTFRAVILPKASKGLGTDLLDHFETLLRRLILFSLAAAFMALLGWLIFESGEMADAGDVSALLAAIGDVGLHTDFGLAVLGQTGCIAIAGLIVAARYGRVPYLAPVFAGLAVALQLGHAHALAMYGGISFLLAADMLHLVAGAIWLGGLLPLLLFIRATPERCGALGCRYFSPLGKLCVAIIAATAFFQGWVLSGGLPGLIGTGYGWLELSKLGLFLILTGFAVTNRYWLAPALLGEQSLLAGRRLIASIAVQTGFGVAVILAAGILSSLPPGLHTQPLWPFSKQFSLITIREDADFRREAVGAVAALAGALFVFAAGLAFRRLRWIGLVVAVVIVWFAVPHLDLLLADAYPTSFYRSPTGFSAAAIVDGAGIYPQYCASCHGAEGRGDGPMAKTLPIPAADLTAGHLWGHTDGELFWWLSHGIDAPEGGNVMPVFAAILSENQRWDLIDYIRANNAGLAHKATRSMTLPVQAPDFEIRCGSAKPIPLRSLHGKVVRLVFDGGSGESIGGPIESPIEVITVHIAVTRPDTDPRPECSADDPAIQKAYAIVAGIGAQSIPGTQFLIDPNGWLRAMQLPGQGAMAARAKDWDDPEALLAAVQQICSNPIAPQDSSHAHHP